MIIIMIICSVMTWNFGRTTALWDIDEDADDDDDEEDVNNMIQNFRNETNECVLFCNDGILQIHTRNDNIKFYHDRLDERYYRIYVDWLKDSFCFDVMPPPKVRHTRTFTIEGRNPTIASLFVHIY